MFIKKLSELWTTSNPLPPKKQGLDAHVHVVNAQQLTAMTDWHPFNKNLLVSRDKDPDFMDMLVILDQQMMYVGDATYFIICDAQKRFIASATLRDVPDHPEKMVFEQISVHKDFRNQGYATRILTEIKNHVNNNRPEISELYISKFEEMGQMYIRHKMIEIASQFNADIYEQSESFFSEPVIIPRHPTI